MESFQESGFPSVKDEEWKYTNVEPVVSQPFALANGEVKDLGSADIR